MLLEKRANHETQKSNKKYPFGFGRGFPGCRWGSIPAGFYAGFGKLNVKLVLDKHFLKLYYVINTLVH
jgi:hypothetical protein